MVDHIVTETAAIKAEAGASSYQSNVRSWKDFAALINTTWRKGAAAIIETGRLILAAKAELDRDEFDSLLKRRLDCGDSVARKLLRIADNEIICAHEHRLPPCWTTIYELSKVKDDVLKAAFANGTIHPGMERKDAAALRHPPDEGNGQDTGISGSKTEAVESTFKKLVAAWEAASESDHRQLFDRLGCAELIAAMSPELVVDFCDRLRGIDMAAISTKSTTLTHTLTDLLHTVLRTAEAPNSSDQDKAHAFATLVAINRKLKATNRTLCDVVIVLGKQKCKARDPKQH
jgi:hypothetical protein